MPQAAPSSPACDSHQSVLVQMEDCVSLLEKNWGALVGSNEFGDLATSLQDRLRQLADSSFGGSSKKADDSDGGQEMAEQNFVVGNLFGLIGPCIADASRLVLPRKTCLQLSSEAERAIASVEEDVASGRPIPGFDKGAHTVGFPLSSTDLTAVSDALNFRSRGTLVFVPHSGYSGPIITGIKATT